MSPTNTDIGSSGGKSGINKEFLEKLLNKRIHSFQVETGSKCGDNFTSILYAIRVVVKEEKKEEEVVHLLCKMYPALAARQKFLNESQIFTKEIKIYTEYIPELIKFQETMCPMSKGQIRLAVPPFVAGQSFDSTLEGMIPPLDVASKNFPIDNYLMMIDIRKTWGYRMTEKRLGLDFDHCVLVMKELAKTHALGWAYKSKMKLDRLSSKFPYFVETCFHRGCPDFVSLLERHFKLVSEIVEEHFGANQRVMEGMERIRKITPLEIVSSFIPDDGQTDEDKVTAFLNDKDTEPTFREPWIVSLHGDTWVNNMMFRYSQNDPEIPIDLMMVDLQLYREACPTSDLAYMFYTSTNYEFRKAHLDTLLQIYHGQFLTICTELDVEPLQGFTITNLASRFRRAKIFGFIMASMVLPIILSTDDSANLDDVNVKREEEDGSREAGLDSVFMSLIENSRNNTVLCDRLVEIVQEFMDNGIF